MNERIKELAEQAGADFMRRINYNNLEGKEYEEDAGVIFDSNESLEKFAELIVRECIGCCEQVISDPVPASVDTWLNGGSQCIDEIKQHFGVE